MSASESLSDSTHPPLQPQPAHTATSNHHPGHDRCFDPVLPASQRGSPFAFPASSFFDDAFRSTPSPPPPPPLAFLDAILNPTPAGNNTLPVYSSQPGPPRQRPHSPIVSIQAHGTMPPTRSRTQRPARLPNGYVDLTADPPSDPPIVRAKRPRPTPGPSQSKRQKRDDGTATEPAEPAEPNNGIPEAKVEEIDLSGNEIDMQQVLQKQREDTVKSQQERATTFSTLTCVICMDTPTDLTATGCGHLFCHTCLMEALIAGENRTGPDEPKRSQCPVCRKFLNRNKANDTIPLLIKKGLATQPRKTVSVSAAKVT